ncbi:uncharacterized protein G2W53_020511 [Senna tora]|uniref:Uncharacterized protein n=1 Tax=Senna tora TaxID=362788 RepID=A0A834TY11_9FABA|nr:uncharacterized protein G2W53_020511 [Senna tora]
MDAAMSNNTNKEKEKMAHRY